MSRLVIVRHGDTFAPSEAPRRIGSRTDLPLVASGLAQAEALGLAFTKHEFVFERVLAGPLARARQTAATIVATMTGATPTVVVADWLAEIDHGPDEDQPEALVVARIGREALDRWEAAAETPPGWDVDAPRRMAAWRALLAEPTATDTLVVTSAGTARFALLALGTGAPHGRAMKLRTGAYGLFVRADPARFGWSISAWNIRPGEPYLTSSMP